MPIPHKAKELSCVYCKKRTASSFLETIHYKKFTAEGSQLNLMKMEMAHWICKWMTKYKRKTQNLTQSHSHKNTKQFLHKISRIFSMDCQKRNCRCGQTVAKKNDKIKQLYKLWRSAVTAIQPITSQHSSRSHQRQTPHKMNFNTAAILSVVYFGCLLGLGCCKTVHLNSPNALAANEQRKPFVSPEQPALLQNYKRTKRQTSKQVVEFQAFLTKIKNACAADMGFAAADVQKSLLYEEHPTPREKCLMECILKRTEIMSAKNKISTDSIGRIADLISNNNALVIAIAVETAKNCNKSLKASQPCEAAAQINKCMANELKMRKIKLFY